LPPISLGAALKMINTRYNPSGVGEYSSFDQTGQGFGVGLDVGLRAQISEEIAYGAVLKDFPSFVIEKNLETGKYTEFNPVVLLMGGTFAAGHSTILFAEGQIPLYEDQVWKMAGAIEQVFFNVIRGRIGVRKTIQSIERSGDLVLTTGLGLRLKTDWVFGSSLNFDASYEYNTINVFSNVLNFSMLFAF